MAFDTIPAWVGVPGHYVEFNKSQAQPRLLTQPKRALIIGQRLAAGTVAAAVPTRITRKETAWAAFGYGSMLAEMCEYWLRQTETVELWAVALNDNGAGVAAAGTITFTGPSTAAGTLQLYVTGRKISVLVPKAATAAQVATATAAAINADTKLPITAAVAGGTPTVVDITARHKGEVGNSIDVRANYNQGDTLPAGIGIAIVCPTGGTTNPVVSAALAAIGAVQYTTIVAPYIDATNLTALEAELALRWDGLHANDGHLVTTVPGTHADGSTLGDSRNAPHVSILGVQKSPTWGPIIAVQAAAADAAEPDPARPRHTLALRDVLAPSVADRYLWSELRLHLADGISTFYVDDGGVCRIQRLVTTYKTNEQGIPDTSYQSIERMRSLSYIRFMVRARLSQVFPRHKLADDGGDYDPLQAIATPSIIKAELIALFRDLVRAGIVENIEQFIQDIQVVRNTEDRDRVDILLPPDLVNQFLISATAIQFR
jgi:phage tail sheath gpL-like